MLATVVEDDPRASSLIAITKKYREGHYSFLHLTLDTNLIMLRFKEGGIKYHF